MATRSTDDIVQPAARQLLLNLLLVIEHGTLHASQAVRACSVFDVSPNNTRVALNRLLASGLVAASGRGSYTLGEAGRAVGEDVGAWRRAEDAVRPWDGGWVLALTGALGRVDRNALRRRERALAMVGMRQLEAEMHVRADNLAGGVAQVRQRLHALGLDERAPIFLARDFDEARNRLASELWDCRMLEKRYKEEQKRLNRSMANLTKLPLVKAVKESYLLGNEAIRLLVFDPLLPEPLVAVSERQKLRETVLAYEAAGQAIWRKFLSEE